MKKLIRFTMVVLLVLLLLTACGVTEIPGVNANFVTPMPTPENLPAPNMPTPTPTPNILVASMDVGQEVVVTDGVYTVWIRRLGWKNGLTTEWQCYYKNYLEEVVECYSILESGTKVIHVEGEYIGQIDNGTIAFDAGWELTVINKPMVP